MRKIKYIISILFITIVFVFIGEMHVWNIDSFYTEYMWTSFFLQEGGIQEEMISDLQTEAKKNDCLLFVVETDLQSAYSENVNIYCMDGVEEYLGKESSIKEGEFTSMFTGDVKVSFYSMEEIEDITEHETYYIIGSYEDAVEFKKETINEYAGNFPKLGYTYLHSVRNIMGVWCVGALFFLLLSLFETTLLKKEMMVRFVYGESLGTILYKKILQDILFYSLYSALVGVVLKFGFNIQTDFQIKITLGCLITFLVLNSLLYLRLFWCDYKSALSRGKGNKAVLSLSYAFKVVTMAIVTLISAVCMEMMAQGIDFWLQKPFFKEHSQYSYMSVRDTDMEGYKTELAIIQQEDRQGELILQAYMDTGYEADYACLYYNKGSIDYLKENIEELKDYSFEEGRLYFILPEEYAEMAQWDLISLVEIYEWNEGDYSSTEILIYDDNAWLIGIDGSSSYSTDRYKNPAVVLDTNRISDNMNSYSYLVQGGMFTITEEEWQEYLGKEEIIENASSLTNVYECYQHQLKMNQRVLLLGVTTLILLMVMEFLIIKTTLRYESLFKSTELAIKTVHGYTIYEKYTTMFLSTIITATISIVLCMIIALVAGIGQIHFMLLGYLIIMIMDMWATFLNIRKMEQMQIQKILKGGIV